MIRPKLCSVWSHVWTDHSPVPRADLAFFGYICAYRLEHFIINMISLYFLGRQVEEILSAPSGSFFYLLSGMVASHFVCFHTKVVAAERFHATLYGLFARLSSCVTQLTAPISAVGAIPMTLYTLVINIIRYSDSRNQPSWAYRRCGRRLPFLAVIFPVKWEKDVQY